MAIWTWQHIVLKDMYYFWLLGICLYCNAKPLVLFYLRPCVATSSERVAPWIVDFSVENFYWLKMPNAFEVLTMKTI